MRSLVGINHVFIEHIWLGCVRDRMHDGVTPKQILERGSGVDRKFDFLNCCSDGRSETADAKISSKRNRFDIHMLDSEVRWITCE
jgi:hypothetical protein